MVNRRVEEILGWVNASAWMAKTNYRGLRGMGWLFTLVPTANNLVRMRKLAVTACQSKWEMEEGVRVEGPRAIHPQSWSLSTADHGILIGHLGLRPNVNQLATEVFQQPVKS